MRPRIHFTSFLLGVVFGGTVTFFTALAIAQSSDSQCWLHARNTGTRAIQIHALGGRLPLRTTMHFGFLPVPQRKEHWGRLLQPGEMGSVPYAPGGTINVMEMRAGVGISHPVWTGAARTLVAQINADNITNITFQVTSESQ